MKMIIVLDTNILRKDFLLKSSKIEILNDFVSKTWRAAIVLPQIVYDELTELYKNELINHWNQIHKEVVSLEGLLINSKKENTFSFDIAKEIEKFQTNFVSRLKLTNQKIIPHNEKHLSELAKRAVQKKKPYNINGKGFRDCLIWLSLFDIAKKFNTDCITFISNNTKDFSDNENKLHPELYNEASEKGVRINYYTSLGDFLKKHASKIDFINKDWVFNNISIEYIEDNIKAHWDDNAIFEIEEKINRKDICEYIPVEVYNTDLEDFFVYQMQNGEIKVEAYYNSEIEYEIHFKTKTYEYFYFIAESEVHLTLENNKVKEISFSSLFIS
jgi:hypothetical protein